MVTIYDFKVQDGNEELVSLDIFKNKTLLLVNVASKCGFTKQYVGLESLYRQYKDRDFLILAFPCNQFSHQEPGSNAEIQQFCQLHYDVTFPVFAKIEVNGSNAAPLYQYLKQQQPGWWGNRIKWNFTKFLVTKEGEVVKRFSPFKDATDIEKVLVQYLE